MRFIVINGPNLNLLGAREPHIYGRETLADLEGQWRRRGTKLGIGVDTYQSNHEGEIIEQIQVAGPRNDAIVINAGAYTHYSYAIYDALMAVGRPTVEVHISDINGREPWRATSVTAPAALRVIVGRGTEGYLDAIDFLEAHLNSPAETLAYGPHPDQVIDLRVPASPRGVVALLHGGFWREIWARDITEQLAARLADRGWITANIEYRRGLGAFHESIEDVTAALECIRSTLAGRGMAIESLPVIGHSAGGYLAIRSVAELGGDAVALAPVVDLDSISAARPDDDPVSAYLGGKPDQASATWEAARLVGAGKGRVHIVHGSDDDTIPIEHVQAFADHDSVSLTVLNGVDHRGLTDPHRASFDAVVAALEGTLR